MDLSAYKVVATIAVSDMGRAPAQLGLARRGGPDDNRVYECADGSLLHVYLSPGHAGGAT